MASRVKAIVMFSLGFPIITSVVFGQTDNQASRVFSAEASGVPTLKRREPLANSSSSPSPGLPSSPNEKLSNDQGTGWLKVRFEGLFTFKTAEVLRFFREQGIELSKNQMPETE